MGADDLTTRGIMDFGLRITGMSSTPASEIRHDAQELGAARFEAIDFDDIRKARDVLGGFRQPDQVDLVSRLGLVTDIPSDVESFYTNVGFFIHPRTGLPVENLTAYQIQSWRDKDRSNYLLYLKSQKLGMTSFFLMQDLHYALTSCRGKQILIVGQTKEKAVMHMQVLRNMIRNSPVYAPYLVEKRGDGRLLPDVRSKVDRLYIHNPDDLKRPTEIIAVGIVSLGSLISFMDVKHIHMSDVTMASMASEKMKQAFGGLYSRLMNTRGTMVIECAPKSPEGPVWDIVNDAPELKKNGYLVELTDEPVYIPVNGFLVRRLTYKMGIEAGLMDDDLIKKERHRLGPMFGMYYETDFYSSDETFFSKDLVNKPNPWSKEQAVVINRVQADLATAKQNFDGEPIKTYESDLHYRDSEEWKRRQEEAKRNADKYRDQSMSADGRSGTGERMGNIVDNDNESSDPMTETERNKAIKESLEIEKKDTERIKRLSSKEHIDRAFGISPEKKKRQRQKKPRRDPENGG